MTVPAIHGFHRLDDQDRVTSTHAAADLDEGTRTRLGTHIGGPDHRRGDDARVLGKIDSFSCGAGRSRRRGLRLARQTSRCTCGRRPFARHPHPLTIALKLDLGKSGLVEEPR